MPSLLQNSSTRRSSSTKSTFGFTGRYSAISSSKNERPRPLCRDEAEGPRGTTPCCRLSRGNRPLIGCRHTLTAFTGGPGCVYWAAPGRPFGQRLGEDVRGSHAAGLPPSPARLRPAHLGPSLTTMRRGAELASSIPYSFPSSPVPP